MKKFLAVSAAALVASATLAVPAWGAVNTPPTTGSITVFPERDMVVADGYANSKEVQIKVLRNGVEIGNAAGTTGGATSETPGLLEVNHPGGVCWNGTTPDIIAGDQIQVTEVGSENTDQTAVADVAVKRAAPGAGEQARGDFAVENAAGQIVVRGTAQTKDANGTPVPLPLDQLEQRFINTAFSGVKNERRIAAPGEGEISYDAPGSINWTATYSGLSAANKDAVVEAEARILWLGVDPLSERELTIYEAGLTGGPGMPECPAASANAVTAFDDAAVNKDSGTLLVSGTARPDTTDLDLELSSSAGGVVNKPAVPLQNGPTDAADKTWKVEISRAELDTLKDGTLTAKGAFTTPGANAPLGGATKTLQKDVVVPKLSATLAPGSYDTARSVGLSSDGGEQIRYTLDGSTPGPNNSRLYDGTPIPVNSSQTIKAFSTDAAGNRADASFVYTIRQASATTVNISPLVTATRPYKVNTTRLLTGKVSPAHAGKPVTVTVQRYNTTTRAYVTVARTQPKLNTASAYSVPFKPTIAGSYKVQVIFAGDADHKPSSATRGFSVIR